METYVVNRNAQPNGDHEVHKVGCGFFPSNNMPLGQFTACAPAVLVAKRVYPQSNGCFWCSNECHTT